MEITYRHGRPEDLDALVELDRTVWGEMAAPREWIAARLGRYAYGHIIADGGGRIIGCAVTLRIRGFNPDNPDLTWFSCTGGGAMENHDPVGETVYGVNFSVREDAPEGVGSELIRVILRDLIVAGNCVRGMVGCRLPGFAAARAENPAQSAEDYMRSRGANGRYRDPQVRLFSEIGLDDFFFQPVRPLPNYFEDPESCNYGALMLWPNPHYRG